MLFLVLILFLTLFPPALTHARNGGPEMKQQRFSMMHDGIERTYFLHVPDAYQKEHSVPLLILLHGGGGLARRMLAFTGFGPYSEKYAFIVVAPDGVERHWNDGRVKIGHKAHDENVDDVGFIAALIQKLESSYNIDRGQVFASGISNGAMMSYRLGLELPDKITAIAPVVGAVPASLAEKLRAAASEKKSPVPAIIFNGTDDPLVPFNGGEVKMLLRKLGTVLSVAESAQLWAARNGCVAKPKISSVAVKDEGMKVSKTTFSNSTGNADVVLYAIDGAGHTWPGPEPGAQYLPPRLIGRACHDLDATALIWQFFQSHSLKGERSK